MKKIYSNKEFMSEASSILSHNEFIKTKSIVHHGTTRYNHSVRVAYLAYLISKTLGLDTKSIVKGAVLHDFFLVRNDKNAGTQTKMLIEHPKIAKENAKHYFGINDKEQNIIESHMFPISNTVPKFKESWVVSICDKLVSMFESVTYVKSHVNVWIVLLLNLIK